MRTTFDIYHIQPGVGTVPAGKIATHRNEEELWAELTDLHALAPFQILVEKSPWTFNQTRYFLGLGLTFTGWQTKPPSFLRCLKNKILQVRLFSLTLELWKPPF